MFGEHNNLFMPTNISKCDCFYLLFLEAFGYLACSLTSQWGCQLAFSLSYLCVNSLTFNLPLLPGVTGVVLTA